MKKQFLALLFVTALLITMVGCSAANAVHQLDAAEDRIEEKIDAVEDTVEKAVEKAVSQPAVTQPAPVPTEAAGDTITKTQAENIALEYVGVTAEQVTRLRTEYEVDDGVPQYDVEFHEGDWEYEFEISAKDGKILSFDKDHKYD